jgi:predicted nucleotide-binding protein (sugar kinase/HSP70/actin superfamily)
MKVTFPQMGNLFIIVKGFLEALNMDFVAPPPTSKRTLEIGTKYAPELACLPFKIILGNYIEGIEKGADTLLISGGRGPCRMGFFSEVHRVILESLGYDIKLVSFEFGTGEMKELGKIAKEIFKKNRVFQILKEVKNAIKVAVELDKLDDLTYKVRPREKVRGTTDSIMRNFKEKIDISYGSEDILCHIYHTKKLLKNVEIDKDFKPLRIGIVGEIYIICEPFTNLNIAKILGNMGIEIHISVKISEFIIEHMLKPLFRFERKRDYEKAAKKYLDTLVGGHGQQTIGHSVIYSQKGYDGIIQIYPFTCMPEIVAQSILPKVSEDLNIPIMTLIIDELTGEAGYKTRVEAFVDLLQRRKEKKIESNEYILSGN